MTEDEPELHGRQVVMPRGTVVGGSSSINSMVYMRGQPQEFLGMFEPNEIALAAAHQKRWHG